MAGCNLWYNPSVTFAKTAIFDNWYWVLAYPGIEVSTAEARAILPKSYTRQDVISHGRHLGGFVHACHTHQENLAAMMMKDVIAEPYREALLPNFAEVKQATRDLGALATGDFRLWSNDFLHCTRFTNCNKTGDLFRKSLFTKQ